MTEKPKPLSDTARALLTAAATRDDHLIRPPQLPTAAARQVVRSLLNMRIAEEIPAPIDNAGYVWRKTDAGSDLMLRATNLGLTGIQNHQADSAGPVSDAAQMVIMASADAHNAAAPEQCLVGDVPDGEPKAGWDATQALPQPEAAPAACKSPDAAEQEPTMSVRSTRQSRLRQAAQALLTAWDEAASADVLDEHFAALRAALVIRSAPPPSIHAPRDTKRVQVLAMLRRPEGASGPQIAEAMGWAPHTVRGFLAGLPKKGITVNVLERVRQIGPNRAGAKGSYTVYRVADEA